MLRSTMTHGVQHGSAGEVVRRTRARRRMPSRGDAVLQYSIGDSTGGRTRSDRRFGDHIGMTITIHEKPLPWLSVVVLCEIDPVAPTLDALKIPGSEQLRIGRVKIVCPRSTRDVQWMRKRAGCSHRYPYRTQKFETKGKARMKIDFQRKKIRNECGKEEACGQHSTKEWDEKRRKTT